MAFQPGRIPSNRGKASAVDPIKNPEDISRIKELLRDRPRELCLFQLGINTAFRAGDLLNLERTDVIPMPNGRYKLSVKEQKTGKVKVVELNYGTSQALLRHMRSSNSGRYVFEGQRGRLTSGTLSRLMKQWCQEAEVEGKIASHTLRKTFARQHLDRGAKITTLMHVLNHSSERQTLAYLGIMSEDVNALYQDEV